GEEDIDPPLVALHDVVSRSRSARLAASPWTPVTFLPIAFTASSSCFWRRPVMNTCAPSSTKSFAVASAMPEVSAVRTTTLQASFPMSPPIVLRVSTRPRFPTLSPVVAESILKIRAPRGARLGAGVVEAGAGDGGVIRRGEVYGVTPLRREGGREE